MAGHTKVGVGYNVQLAVDANHKLIVEQQVSSQVLDMGLRTATVTPARTILDVATIDAVADKGYFKTEDIVACEAAGILPHVPRPQRGQSVTDGFFRKDEFRYDPERDGYICPANQLLSTRYESRLRDLKKTTMPTGQPVLAVRSARAAPTGSAKSLESRGRRFLSEWQSASRQDPNCSIGGGEESVEHQFGTIKQWMNQGAFLMRGLVNVRCEFSLTALAYNLRRALNILGAGAMIRAINA